MVLAARLRRSIDGRCYANRQSQPRVPKLAARNPFA